MSSFTSIGSLPLLDRWSVKAKSKSVQIVLGERQSNYYPMKLLFSAFLTLVILSISSTDSFLHAQDRQATAELSLGVNFTAIPIAEEVSFEVPSGLVGIRQVLTYERGPDLYWGFSLRRLSPKNWYQELAIVGLGFQTRHEANLIEDLLTSLFEPQRGVESNYFDFITRLEVGKNFARDRRFIPGIGLGVDAHLFHIRHTPINSADFPRRLSGVQVDLRIIPRFEFQLNERLSFVTKLPLSLASTTWYTGLLDNPRLTSEERTFSQTESGVNFSDLQLNLGISFRI